MKLKDLLKKEGRVKKHSTDINISMRENKIFFFIIRIKTIEY